MEEKALPTSKYAFLSGSWLKLIAIVTMTIDHIGAVLLPQYYFLRGIGRIAFPIYCFLLVEGYYHTRDVKKYLLRLSLFALISELAFDLAFFGRLSFEDGQNVFFTLALGLLCIWLVDQKISAKWLEIVVLLGIFSAAMLLRTDYGGGGIVIIMGMYYLREKEWVKYAFCIVIFYFCFGWLEVLGAIAFLFIHFYNGRRGFAAGTILKYFFYIYYPLHLLIIRLIFVTLYRGGPSAFFGTLL